MERREQLEQKQQYADRQSKRFTRRAKYSLDPDNKRVCSARAEEWQSRAERLSESVEKNKISDIIKTENVRNMTISSIEHPIELPIEQRHTGKGNPNAVVTFGVELNNRQKKLLEQLADFDSRTIIEKNSVNMADLSALTANTGHEFAMFTKGEKRLIIRGNEYKVEIDIKAANELSSQGYKWSGHTHPGSDFLCMQPSDGDYAVLDCFKQSNAVIYNSKGNFRTFEKRE